MTKPNLLGVGFALHPIADRHGLPIETSGNPKKIIADALTTLVERRNSLAGDVRALRKLLDEIDPQPANGRAGDDELEESA